MSETPIQIEYNETLSRLATLLGQVDRSGNYVTSGTWSGPLPRVDVAGLGTLAFPLLDMQAKELAKVTTPAPYGRGEETLYDASVRSTRQLSSDQIHLGGASWSDTLNTILKQIKEGLGCGDLPVKAELYKLLLYETGDFFAPHRDTEKAERMFGTLVIALPSFHAGGDLIVRHKEHEERISLAPQDVSELRYAAFYADCEHEVEPITQGNRLCLTYNLIYEKHAPGASPAAPDYDSIVKQVAAELRHWTSAQKEAAKKAAWLLDYDYTPDGLSFAGLKHVDAARADVLLRAANRADCALYLGMVHIEESGPAEIQYNGYSRYSRYHDEDDDASDEDFEIVEVSESNHHITNWITPADQSVDFGELPLLPGELLPAGALDDELPDEQRVTEATGNAGATFERSYHRAVLVFWDRSRTPEILLRAGAAAAVAYLAERLSTTDLDKASCRAEMISNAKAIIRNWDQPSEFGWRTSNRSSGIAPMLELLLRLGDARLAGCFIETVVVESYESGINKELAACLMLLKIPECIRLAGLLMEKNGETCSADCIELLNHLVDAVENCAVLDSIAGRLILALPHEKAEAPNVWTYRSARQATALSGIHIANLFRALRAVGSELRIAEALALLSEHPEIYPPDNLIVPALKEMQNHLGLAAATDASYAGLWQTAMRFLLGRSATPPPKPTDWSQPVKKNGCACADCKALLRFAADPDAKECRLPLAQGRRQHLHQRINGDDMDMTHETERRGRPYTLVCKKTRRHYKQRLEQYGQDVASMTLLGQRPPAGAEIETRQLEIAVSFASIR